MSDSTKPAPTNNNNKKDNKKDNNKNNGKEEATEKKEKTEKKKGAEKFAATKFINPTPEGALKDFSKAMTDSYQPQEVEAAWDTWWEKKEFFKPDIESKEENFVMVIPPPNVTGTLHLGHALTVSIEDSLSRWHRMNGHNTLWVPGTDHAGIATQVVVEKKLMKEEGKTRHDIGREEFIKKVWEWKEKHGDTITSQLRRVGASVDWSRFSFTMDEKLSIAVQEAFIRMYNKKLIYRQNRLVNWDCALRTAISTVEVEYIELKGSTKLKIPGYKKEIEFGVIHEFAYKVLSDDGKTETGEELIVATTRIETMLGDVAVAVHPDDKRYQHLIGKLLKHPFISDRHMKIIADPVLVDMSFGTGAVKVTPAHDPNDFLCGQRNKLQFINIFTDDGKINENGGLLFQGLLRFDVRELIITELTKLNIYRGKKDNPMSLGLTQRSKDVMEPVMRPQWWCDCKAMADRAIKVVDDGKLLILPQDPHVKVWKYWLSNIQDWCISRQLWWGHRIPAYLIHIDGQSSAPQDEENNWVVAPTYQEALEKAAIMKGVDKSKIKLIQDPDVLDTWFSSGLFPFSVFSWPNQTPDLDKFYPTSLLETGSDILFFWVARMVMMGLELTDKLPFSTVYLHSLVRDKIGRKMSKSLGNVIDPIDVINGITLEELHQKLYYGNLDKTEIDRAKEGQKKDFPDGIPECGADGLRFGLLSYTAQGRDINLDIQRVVAYRQFGNKLWQATKFVLKNFSDYPSFTINYTDPINDVVQRLSDSKLFGDQWILHRLYQSINNIDKGWKSYELGQVSEAIYQFFLHDLCDVYLELTKPIMNADLSLIDNKKAKECSLSVLYLCFHSTLRLLHPLMPFITEELYHRLPGAIIDPNQIDELIKTKGKKASGSITVASYPIPSHYQQFNSINADKIMDDLKLIISTIRQVRASLGLTKQRPDVYGLCGDQESYDLIKLYAKEICTLSNTNQLIPLNNKSDNNKIPTGAISLVAHSKLELHIPLSGLIDNIGGLIVRMENDRDLLSDTIIKSKSQVNNTEWLKKSKPEVREAAQKKLENDTIEYTKINEFLLKIKSALTAEQRSNYYQYKINELQKIIDKKKEKVDEMKKTLPEDIKKAPKKTLDKIAEAQKEIDNAVEKIEAVKKDQENSA